MTRAAVVAQGPGRPAASPRRAGEATQRWRTVVAVGVLGPLRVVRAGRDVTPTPPKLRQFLALLAASPGEVVRLETIANELWGAARRSATCAPSRPTSRSCANCW